MISDELKSIVEQILKNEDKMHLLDAATEKQIIAFEKEKGIQLPAKLKEWFLISDGGEFYLPSGFQLYGVVHKPIIDTDDDDRPDDKYVVIGSLASGDPVLCEKKSEKISIYNHEAGKIEEDEVYEDFFSFMKDLPNIFGIGG